jgi:hypothetical protein
MPKRIISMTHATKVVRSARPARRVMKTVPIRYFADPQIPKKKANPARPAAKKERSMHEK